jgi:pimeloyl-ACP methyl ester carboxylesterase
MDSFELDVGGPVFVADYGGHGPTMLLVHGLGGSHLNWMSVAGALAHDRRVLAPDLPGFGRSPSGGRSASIAANIRVLEQVIELVGGGPVVLVGNSMGGLLSLGVAAGRSDLLAGLVLVDAAMPTRRGEIFRFDPVTMRFLAAYLVPRIGEHYMDRIRAHVGAEGLVRETLERCSVDASRIDPAMVDAMVALEHERMNRPGWHSPVIEASRSIVQTLFIRAHVQRWIRQVTAPTLIIHGRQDRLVHVTAARDAADLRPDWEYVELDGSGHIPQMETPAEFLAALQDWLARAVASPVATERDRGVPAASAEAG